MIEYNIHDVGQRARQDTGTPVHVAVDRIRSRDDDKLHPRRQERESENASQVSRKNNVLLEYTK